MTGVPAEKTSMNFQPALVQVWCCPRWVGKKKIISFTHPHDVPYLYDFYSTSSTNSNLYPLEVTRFQTLLCFCVRALVSNYRTKSFYVQCVFAALRIVANHRHLCEKQWPIRGVVYCRLVKIRSELIFVFTSLRRSTRSQIFLLWENKSIHTVKF